MVISRNHHVLNYHLKNHLRASFLSYLIKPIIRYQYVHPINDTLSFDIKRMEDIYEQMQGKSDEPHPHAYYTILLVYTPLGHNK